MTGDPRAATQLIVLTEGSTEGGAEVAQSCRRWKDRSLGQLQFRGLNPSLWSIHYFKINKLKLSLTSCQKSKNATGP
jgi:hypothetical protein